MNRTLVSGLVAFALIMGAGLAMSDTAEAGCFGARRCGGISHCGIFNKGCGGGLLARLKAKHCCAPAPVCCEPAPCEPVECEPVECCEPEPCCEPDPCCGHRHKCGLFSRLLGRLKSSSCCGSSGCSTGCGSSGCGDSGCGGSVVVPAEAETESASDAAPPAPPTPDAATDA